MTVKTRRRVFLSVLVVALTIPAETILLRALQTPSDQVAAERWVSSLSADEIDAAAGAIQTYPFAYRRQLMAALTPTRRSEVWRGHVAGYISAHPELSTDVVIALEAARSALTAKALSDPSIAERESLHATAEQLETLLGREEATYVAHYLGPRDGTFASAEPIGMKLASFVRNHFSVLAADYDCECAVSFGCDDLYTTECTDEEACDSSPGWPQCGWWWQTTCDGLCVEVG
jgi:hypothetical protein